MGTTLIDMIGYLRTQQDYRDAEKIRRTLTEVAARGYLITTASESSSINRQKAGCKPGISPLLSFSLRAYLSGREPYLDTHACFVAETAFLSDFTYGCLSLSQLDQMLIVSVDDRYFTLRADGRNDSRSPLWNSQKQARYEHWLEMLQLVYQIWHPLYVYDWSAVTSGLWPATRLEDARALQPSHLYQHNLFGPELVNAIGRERMLQAPAWRTLCLDDGGMMIIPNGLYEEQGQDTMAVVAQALNLPYDVHALERWIARRRST